MGSFRKLFTIGFVAAGFWLFVMNEIGTFPPATLSGLVVLWLVAGVGGMVMMRRLGPGPMRGGVQTEDLPDRPMGLPDAGTGLPDVSMGLPVVDQRTADAFARFASQAGGAAATAKAAEAVAGPETAAARIPSRPEAAPDPHGGRAVVLARARRRAGFDVTRDGTSWFGGLPALGDMAWPRDGSGVPMTPLAQIDLTGLAAHLQVPGLPEHGALAFFAALPSRGAWVGHVMHVARPVANPAAVPDHLPPVENHSFGRPLRQSETAAHDGLYPRMAVERVLVTALPDPDANPDEDADPFDAEVAAALGPGREVNLGPAVLQAALPDGAPWNRDSLLRFLVGAKRAFRVAHRAEPALRKLLGDYSTRVPQLERQLETATDDRALVAARLTKARALLAEVEQTLADPGAALAALAEERDTLEAWARQGDRWQPLTPTELDLLAPALSPWTSPRGLGQILLDETPGVHRRMADCVAETLLDMAVAEDGIFATLPAPARDAVNGPWRQPYGRRRHQMFGRPDAVQSAAEDNANAYLLLQLQCDDIAGFHWGDAGVLQFWIRPEDLQAGRWHKAQMTFDGN